MFNAGTTAAQLLAFLQTTYQTKADSEYVSMVHPGATVVIPDACLTNAYVQSVINLEPETKQKGRLFNFLSTQREFSPDCDATTGLWNGLAQCI